ncbi:DUF3822 family protein [Flagellimonas aequoris]|uniref:DUF3822 family protein n=1 Tax=Flagellimonas aequoris TaxID=2306997 RepID=A0A418N5G5_9FLAO|nr:DUF3822 family protein [Allomuricauda aequoris]RIV69341.1 DUF3822 family protein [Allomuricauda aequoris]TXK01010.1 DUF3822 family protein [Allomuricauda aequoris]
MTEKITDIAQPKEHSTYRKLSIQVSLNGLSFCVLDTITNKILAFEKVVFSIPSTPYLMLKELKAKLSQHGDIGRNFSEVVVIHKNNMFGLVPKPLFNKDELPNYLKFNAKIMANDLVAYDELPNQEIINVYIPYTNVNNYIFELFGEFEFKHSGTVLISTLLSQSRTTSEPTYYVQVSGKEMEMMVASDKKLLFYNQFEYKTKEDFLYFLLFSLEQLQMDLEKIQLKLFGSIEEGDPIFDLCYQYIKNVSVFVPSNPAFPLEELENESIDFSILSSL